MGLAVVREIRDGGKSLMWCRFEKGHLRIFSLYHLVPENGARLPQHLLQAPD